MKNIVLALCLASFCALPAYAGKEGDGRAQTEKIIEEYILAHPEVIEKSMREYYARMKKEAEARELQNSLSDIKKVEPGDSPSLGEPSAQVTIVEFSDFQCPYCASVVPVLKDLRLKYGGRVRIVFKHFPLENHKAARPASKACIAAGKQGKFWEYHDLLFSRQGEWSQALDRESVFLGYAKSLGLDENQFTREMGNPEFDKIIDRDLDQGTALGVNSTPSFFVNGATVRGAVDLAFFSTVIDKVTKLKK